MNDSAPPVQNILSILYLRLCVIGFKCDVDVCLCKKVKESIYVFWTCEEKRIKAIFKIKEQT